MKFAVVEYSSKTGRVWQHTDERPNFLCDPQKEIDPTSFGCYVSALKGEHVPLTGLITPSSPLPIRGEPAWPVGRGRVRGLRTFFRKTYKRLSGNWPHYSIEYLKQFDVLMVVHQLSDAHEMTRLVERLRREAPHIFIIGVPTQPYGILKNQWENRPEVLAELKRFAQSCHIFITIVEHTLKTWENLLGVPVAYLPQPYPAHYASQFFLPRAQKKPSIFVAGVTSRPQITKGLVVAKKLQQEFPEYIIHVTQTPGEALDLTELGDARYELVPFLQWREHLEMLRHVALVINTDYTATRGRVQVDCATVGTPSIGADSDGQADLFPQLPATPDTSVDDLVAQGRRLLMDKAWYAEIVEYARKRLAFYEYDLSAERLNALVKKYKAV